MTTHDALIQARLENLQSSVTSLDLDTPAEGGVRSTPRSQVGETIRARLGHRLVAIGAALAGEEEPAQAEHAL